MTDEEKAKEWVRTNSGYSTKEFHGLKAIEAYLAGLKYNNKQIAELEKENAELKANNSFLNNLVREKEQRGLEIQEDLLMENEKLKEQCSILADYNTCHSTCKNENVEMKKQLDKAKELLTRFVMASVYFNGKETDLIKEAEQFLREGE